jgi:hypothetical protein
LVAGGVPGGAERETRPQAMSALWTRIGRVISILIQIIFVLAALVGVIIFLRPHWNPAIKLIADIYPMEFRVPVNVGQLTAVTRSNQPINPAIAQILAVTNANGFARIDLTNEGNLPIDDVHIFVSGANIYVKGNPNIENSVIFPAYGGITVPKLEQGNWITIYVWSSIISGTYSSWDNLSTQFTIMSSQGVADKKFHITVGSGAEFIDKHFILIASVFSLLFLLSAVGLLIWAFRFHYD